MRATYPWYLVLSQTTQLAGASFFEGGEAYNYLSFWISLLGTILTFGAVIATMAAALRAKTASEAALDAATATATRLDRTGVLVDVVKLCQLSERASTLLREKNFDAAVIAVFDLRAGVTEFQMTAKEAALMSGTEWQSMCRAIDDVHGVLVCDKDEPGFQSQAHDCQSKILRVHVGLHQIKANAAKQVGGTHANSR